MMPYFCDVLNEDLIIFNDKPMDKSSLLEILSERLCLHYKLDFSMIHQKICDREKTHSTGIGAGIAIPHCRLPDIPRIYAAVLISQSPIEFEALDEKPVQLVFYFISPLKSAQEHLKFLHFITIFSRPELYEKAIKTRTPGEFLDLWLEICRQESKL